MNLKLHSQMLGIRLQVFYACTFVGTLCGIYFKLLFIGIVCSLALAVVIEWMLRKVDGERLVFIGPLGKEGPQGLQNVYKDVITGDVEQLNGLIAQAKSANRVLLVRKPVGFKEYRLFEGLQILCDSEAIKIRSSDSQSSSIISLSDDSECNVSI